MQHESHSTLYWIVDSGATYHISHLTPTHNNIKASHDFVDFLNGGHVAIEIIGSIKLSKYLSLDGVLHVPKFRVNLISMSKLTRALKCIVIFYLDFMLCRTWLRRGRLVRDRFLMGSTTSHQLKIPTQPIT